MSQPPPPPLLPPSSGDAKPQAAPEMAPPLPPDTHPGLYSELSNRTKGIFPQIFEGLNVSIAKSMSQHFQVIHKLNMSSANPAQSGYKFTAMYAGHQSYTPPDVFPICMAEMTPSGDLQGFFIHSLSPRIRTRCDVQVQGNKWNAYQSTTDYKGSDFSASLSVVNPNVYNSGGIFLAQYLQQVSPRVALGSEVMYQRNPAMPGGHMANLTLGARMRGAGDAWELSGQVIPHQLGLHLFYNRQCFPTLRLGAEMEFSPQQGEAVATAGFEYTPEEGLLTTRAQVDTQGNVGAVVERRLGQTPISLQLSALLSHPKAAYRVGIGLNIGGG